MSIEDFIRRLSASLALSGVFLFVAAIYCWSTVGEGDEVVKSIHNVGGSILASFGVVFVAVGLALATKVPPESEGRR